MESRPGFTAAERALMCLSNETIEGLHITGKSQFRWSAMDHNYHDVALLLLQ